MNYFEMGIQKYWAPTSAMSAETKRQHLEQMITSGQYIWAEKIDGNFTRAVITKDRNALQTRGISKVTGTYSELQEKVFFWDSVVNAFQNGDTVILGELYLQGKIDKDVSSYARCLVPKARQRQESSNEYLRWYIFDVLVLDGKDMINTPIEERVKFIPEVVSRINNPLVCGATYQEMDETFFDKINEIFARKGEGAVCSKKGTVYIPNKRSKAWDSVKCKQELSTTVDCVISKLIPCEKSYEGKDITHWQYWQNTRTGAKVIGEYYGSYQLGEPYEPISKNYYYDYPGAIEVSAYDKEGNLIAISNVAGLTDDFKASLRDNFQEEWYLCPISIGGMMISTAKADSSGIGISIRHPYIKSIRKGDLNPREDCTLEKILNS